MENASVTEAHRAFRLLALRLHPDHQSGLSEAERKVKTSTFLSVLSAYQELLAKTGQRGHGKLRPWISASNR